MFGEEGDSIQRPVFDQNPGQETGNSHTQVYRFGRSSNFHGGPAENDFPNVQREIFQPSQRHPIFSGKGEIQGSAG